MNQSTDSAGQQSIPTGAEGELQPDPQFYRFLRYSHILSSALREILEVRFLRQVSPQRLTRAQFCFLKIIALNADLQVGELARCFGVSAATASKNIDKLERLGLVARDSSTEDRRAKVLSVSVQGRRLVREYERLKAAHIAPVITGLGEEKLGELCELLERVCGGLLDEELAAEKTCLRCAGYHHSDCSVRHLQGGCVLEERRAAPAGVTDKDETSLRSRSH